MRFFRALLFPLLVLAACTNNNYRHPDLDNPAYSAPAIHTLTQRIAKDTDNAQLYFERGNALHHIKYDSLALRDYLHAIRLDTTKSAYYGAIGDILFEAHDLVNAADWLQKALRLDPQNPKARLKVAKMFLFQKNHKGAFEQINIVLRADAYEPEAYFLKGMVYKDLKDTAKAISSFQTALQVQPEYKDAHMQLGTIAWARGDSSALQYFMNAYRADTSDLLPIYTRGQYFQKHEDWERAKAEYRYALAHAPEYADVSFAYGYVLLQQDSIDKALPYFDKAAKVDPENANALYNRGLCHEILGNADAARSDYQAVLRLQPGSATAQQGLGRLR